MISKWLVSDKHVLYHELRCCPFAIDPRSRLKTPTGLLRLNGRGGAGGGNRGRSTLELAVFDPPKHSHITEDIGFDCRLLQPF
jgi:hypothetical protein